MSPRVARHLRRAVPAYVVLLLVLAALGAFNQNRLRHELALMGAREDARRTITDLRAEAAVVVGPLAVSRWAQENGMVPAPETEGIEHVMPLAAPTQSDLATGLEVRTVWR